jgi:hypothetical protein
MDKVVDWAKVTHLPDGHFASGSVEEWRPAKLKSTKFRKSIYFSNNLRAGLGWSRQIGGLSAAG